MQQTREHQRLVFLSREPTQWMMPIDLGWLAVAQDDVAGRRAGGVDQALDFQRGVDVGIAPVAVLRRPADIERLEPGGDDDRAHLDLPELLLLLEVDRLLLAAGLHAGLLALVRQDAALEIQADFRIDQHHLGRGLGERNVNRLALAEALVEFVRELRLLVDAVRRCIPGSRCRGPR